MINKRRGILAGLIAVPAVAVIGAVLFANHTRHLDQACTNNLESIYAALTAFVEEYGTLPRAALYPDDPAADDDSLLVELRPFGINEENLVCPATDPILQATGNTYLWNTRLSGKHWSDVEAAQWMMVEINAMSARVGAPHRKHYHVLYSDGEVRSESSPPTVL